MQLNSFGMSGVLESSSIGAVGKMSQEPRTKSPVPPSPDARSPDTVLLHLGAFDRRRFLRRLFLKCAAGPIALLWGAWFVRLRHPAHVLQRHLLRHTGTRQRNLEVDPWKLVDRFDHLSSERHSGERGNWEESLPRHFLVGNLQRTASECSSQSTVLP